MNIENHVLHKFFWPKSIAIVGATNNPFKMSYWITENLIRLNFDGSLYPVNPNAREILGKKVYRSVTEIPEKVDLVISIVPAPKTLDIVRECSAAGIKHIVIVSGGFSEGGEKGKKLHEDLTQLIKHNGLRTLGPNTLSPINTANNLIISFNPIKKMRSGGVSLAFQSGFYEPKLNWLFSHLGINKMLDTGNKLDINELDALEYLSADQETRVIGLHIETLKSDARKFFRLLSETTKNKPVVILKAGRTTAGSSAAASHTGSIARENDLIFDSMLRQAGAIRAASPEEFFELVKAFEYLPLPRGNKVAIITLSGGEGVMATDACEMTGLRLASLGHGTYAKLKKIFPPWDLRLNPFDAGVCMEFHLTNLEEFLSTLEAIPADEGADCVLMQMPPNFTYFWASMPESSEKITSAYTQKYFEILDGMRQYGKPFAMWRSCFDISEMELIQMVESKGLPVFDSSVRAMKAISAMWRYSQYRAEHN